MTSIELPPHCFVFLIYKKALMDFLFRLDSVLYFHLFKHINVTIKTTTNIDSLNAC